ncbi:SRPBCC family protein [Shimia abyssi]|uniref:Polyketide cyclase/dehydrase/lipid transport protein n=1 Tax=Shimia abyssi TaxID=1662395 RepID=A0A2P8FKL5_9RHOB|nr:SRPBCC family protein [Shimia abyssi]PSL22260.1 hypothetical protein CLV88_101686 [Shimia abyssi]
MELAAREDIDIPIEQAFEILCDFEQFERAALRRGAEVSREDDLQRPGVGAKWKARFAFRGKYRQLDLKIVEFERPTDMRLTAVVQGITSDIKIELVALSRTRTRLSVWSHLKSTSLSARLLLKSLKLARSTLTQRMQKRVTKLARSMEDQNKRQA